MKLSSLPKNIKLLLLTSFLSFISEFISIPYLTVYFADQKSSEFAGVVMILYVAIGYIASIVGGYVGDYVDQKKFLFTSYFLQMLMKVVIGFAILFNLSVYLIVAAYLFLSLVTSMTYPAYNALFMTNITSEDKESIYGLRYWAMNLSIAIGSFIGSLLFDDYLPYLFFGASLISLILPYNISKLTYERVEKVRQTYIVKDLLQTYLIPLKDRRWILYLLAGALINTAERSLDAFFKVNLHEHFQSLSLFGFELTGIRMFGVLQLQNTLMVVALTLFVTQYVKRFNKIHAMVFFSVMYTISYALIVQFMDFWPLLILGQIATLGELGQSPITSAIEFDLVPEQNRSSYLALSSLSFSVASMLASITFFLNAAHLVTVYVAVISLLGIAIMYKIMKELAQR